MKRIILTKRDEEIIKFLNDYKCANTSTITNIFFNGSKRSCNRRLKNLESPNGSRFKVKVGDNGELYTEQ